MQRFNGMAHPFLQLHIAKCGAVDVPRKGLLIKTG